MASNQRIEDLKQYCTEWGDTLKYSDARRDELILWKEQGMLVFTSDSNEDLFPTLITEADNAVKIYKKVLLKMETLRDRAINGEDV